LRNRPRTIGRDSLRAHHQLLEPAENSGMGRAGLGALRAPGPTASAEGYGGPPKLYAKAEGPGLRTTYLNNLRSIERPIVRYPRGVGWVPSPQLYTGLSRSWLDAF